MSEQEIQEKIKPEQLDMLLKKASDTELKYLLIVELEGRTGGCGYLYTYDSEVEIIHGKAELVVLERSRYDCEWEERLLVIPFQVPTIVKVSYRNNNPQATNYDEFYIFTPDGWKSIRVEVP